MSTGQSVRLLTKIVGLHRYCDNFAIVGWGVLLPVTRAGIAFEWPDDIGSHPAAQKDLATTAKLADMKVEDFDAVFYPGGHGPLWDLHSDGDSIALIEGFIAAGKPVAAVCHAPAVLLKAKAPGGEPLVQGKQVTGFSNSEEAAVGLTDIVPYLLEDQLIASGGVYQKVDDWNPLVVVDGLVITGQNPGSSEVVAGALLDSLR